MPDLDGFEVAARARREAGGDGADLARAVLLLTSDERAGDAARAREMGLAGYLVKPVRRAALLEAAATHRPRPAARPPPRPGPGPLPTGAGAGADLPPGPAAAPPRRLRLLLADDSADNRRLVQLYLSQLPYVLELAEDGAAALRIVREGPTTWC